MFDDHDEDCDGGVCPNCEDACMEMGEEMVNGDGTESFPLKCPICGYEGMFTTEAFSIEPIIPDYE